jgi:uncharacterized protein YneF (UPF0154 family)
MNRGLVVVIFFIYLLFILALGFVIAEYKIKKEDKKKAKLGSNKN